MPLEGLCCYAKRGVADNRMPAANEVTAVKIGVNNGDSGRRDVLTEKE